MEISRRIFLQKGILAAATCAVAPLKALSQSPLPEGDGKISPNHDDRRISGSHPDQYAALERLDRESFVAAIASAFKVQTSAGQVWLRLLAVNDLSGAPAANPGTFAVLNKKISKTSAVETSGFMLVFSGTSPDSAQGTYTFSHGTLGEFALFIVPEGSNPGVYNAVINRLSPASAVVPAAAGRTVGVGAASPGQTARVPVAPTSSGSGSLSLQRAETRGAQRAAAKD